MKRISMVLLAGLLSSTLAMAQITDFSQHGRATQELRAEGFAIAHPSLPLNSRPNVVNTITGKEIEATVVGRIYASPGRIADLSRSAWLELGLSPETEIRIFTGSPARPRTVVAADTQTPVLDTPSAGPVQFSTDPEVLSRLATLEAWVTEYTPEPALLDRLLALAAMDMPQGIDPALANRLTALETWAALHTPEPDFVARLFALAYDEIPVGTDPAVLNRLTALETWAALQGPDPSIVERLQALESRQGAVEPARAEPAAPIIYHVQPQITQHLMVQGAHPRVIPGIPDPNSGKTYRLQVGAFSTQEAANNMSRLVNSIGFNVTQERTGSLLRVLAIDVPAALVHPAVMRLGIIGVEQVWIRE